MRQVHNFSDFVVDSFHSPFLIFIIRVSTNSKRRLKNVPSLMMRLNLNPHGNFQFAINFPILENSSELRLIVKVKRSYRYQRNKKKFTKQETTSNNGKKGYFYQISNRSRYPLTLDLREAIKFIASISIVHF